MNDFIQGVNWGKMQATLAEDDLRYETARIAAFSVAVGELSELEGVCQVNVGELREKIIDAWFAALGDD